MCFYLSITSTGVSSRASRSLIYFWVSFMITLERSNTAIRFGMAIRAFRISATVHTRFREITGAMAATAMYRTRYGIRPFCRKILDTPFPVICPSKDGRVCEGNDTYHQDHGTQTWDLLKSKGGKDTAICDISHIDRWVFIILVTRTRPVIRHTTTVSQKVPVLETRA